ncbi:MAG: hypothetical protein AAGE01_20860 [Pseudomonadota bacterium]
MELEHGDFRLEWQGRVLHNYPVGGFNEYGIRRLQQAILDEAPEGIPWALVEHPKDRAGLTPEGLEEIRRMHLALVQHGCVCIGMDVAPTFGAILRDLVLSELPVPTIVGDQPDDIDTFVATELARHA